MKEYIVRIEGNDGFAHELVVKCKFFEDAYAKAQALRNALQPITLEALHIYMIQEIE